jgi:hypothetical protein
MPAAPNLYGVWLEFGTATKVVVGPPPTTGVNEIAQFRLYSGPSAIYSASTWTMIYSTAPSEISAMNNLYDLSPAFGHQTYYAATCVDVLGNESPMTAVVSISPLATT